MTLKVHVNQSCCHVSFERSEFTVCVSGTQSCNQTNVDVFLLTNIPSTSRDYGFAKLGLTYPIWMALSERPQDTDLVHVFMAYNETWELPQGWKVCPVASGWGLGSCAWHFTNTSSDTCQSVLVSDHSVSSISPDQCMYPSLETLHASPNCLAVFKDSSAPSLFDLDWVRSHILTEQTPLIITMESVVDLVAAVVDLAHASVHMAKPIVIFGKEVFSQSMLLASMYDWLHPDMQVYIRKCVKFASDANETIDTPLVLLDLVRANRVIFTSSPITNEDQVLAVFCSTSEMYMSEKLPVIEGTRLLECASVEALVKHYQPGQVVTSKEGENEFLIDDTNNTREAYVRSEADLVRVLKIRYDDVLIDTSTNEGFKVDVQSIGIRASFAGDVNDRILTDVDAYGIDVSDSVLAQFIHLVT